MSHSRLLPASNGRVSKKETCPSQKKDARTRQPGAGGFTLSHFKHGKKKIPNVKREREGSEKSAAHTERKRFRAGGGCREEEKGRPTDER